MKLDVRSENDRTAGGAIMSFKEFLQAPFVVNESAKAKAKITRDAAKWFLDFLRNVIVVPAIPNRGT
jgi:hypothetical protein